jgi:hypothetical protein
MYKTQLIKVKDKFCLDQIIFKFLIINFLFFFNDCNDSGKSVNETSNSDSNQDTATVPKAANSFLTGKLHIVYLDKDTFIDYAKNKKGRDEKLAFQFAIEDVGSGALTLGMYAQKNKKFSVPFFLLVGKEYGEDLSGRKVRFSTQKLIKSDINKIITELEKIDLMLKYVAFVPNISLDNNQIYYTIALFREDQKELFMGLGFTSEKFTSIFNTNPSPPATFQDDVND